MADQVLSEDAALPLQVASATYDNTSHDLPAYTAGEYGGGELASDASPLAAESSDDGPVLAMLLADRDVVAGEAIQFRLPQDSFTDADGDALTYTATLSDGSALPAWLTFDADSQVFSGTPTDGVQSFAVNVTASDGTSSVSDSFQLSVKSANAAPVVAHAIADQAIDEDAAWTFSLPAGTFADSDSSGLVYTASLTGNEDMPALPLPSWIHFDPTTQTFSGTPPQDFNGVLDIEVRVNDGSRFVSDSFQLTVTPQPDAPIVRVGLPDQMSLEDQSFSFTLPADGIIDPDGDALSFSATLANGDALPSWLKFDAESRTFSGMPPANFNGDLSISVTASDGVHATSDTFDLDVMSINDAPVLAKAIADMHVAAGKAWSYHVAANTFTDVDSADLTYSATLDTGKPLPSWLTFDGSTQTFSGTPPADWNGPLVVKLSASDGISTADTLFAVSGSAPFVENPLDDQVIGAGRAFHFAVPKHAFDDYDDGALSYKATLADGSVLPAWLKFDADTQIFSGTAPDNFNGEIDVKVTASDGVSKASDTFAITEGGEFEYHLQGTSWGVDQIHYRFDDLFFQSSASYGGGVSDDDSYGPFYGGYWAGFGVDYNIKAGVLVDFTLTSSKYDLTYSFNMDENVSKPVDTLNSNPYVVAVADIDDSTQITSTSDGADNAFQAFVGLAGGAHVYAGAEVYGGIEIPSPFPNIEISAGVGFNLGFDIPAATIDSDGVNFPDGFGAISVDLNGDSGPIGFDFGDGIGHIDLKLPGDMNGFSRALGDAGTSGLAPLTSTVYSDPIISASLDLDALVTKYVPELAPLFHGDLDYALMDVGYENDFKLVGDLRLKEDFTYTPTVHVTMTTSLGQTVSGEAGDKIVFDKPTAEGEGTFSVDATYTTEADLTTTVSLAGDLAFAIKLFALKFNVGIHEGPIDFDLASAEFDPLMKTLEILGGAIPLYTNTRHVVLDTVREHTFLVAYENFRTVAGSGDSFTATTHQISMDGNDHVNVFVGNTYDNIINSFGGNDDLRGLGGDDTINAGTGNDKVDGGAGSDTIDGGDGNDTIDAGDGNNTITGGTGDDQIVAAAGNDTIDSGDGNNTVTAGNGNNAVTGGTGIDHITTGTGDDFIDSGAGNDTIKAGIGDNTISTGAGNDQILVGAGNDTIDAGDDNDKINAGKGDNTVIGGAGNDRILVGAGSDTIDAGDGNDTIKASDGNNTVAGGAGDDRITTGSGNDVIDSGDGHDIIVAGEGDNVIHAGAGLHAITAGAGNDAIYCGGAAGDTINAGEGNNTVSAGAGADHITAGSGNDTIDGGAGADTIVAGNGDNTIYGGLYGGLGKNVITAGSGDDTIFCGNSGDKVNAGGGKNILYGGWGDDNIVALGNADRIEGGGGFDKLLGNGGGDTVIGGLGDDLIIGGKGDDVLMGDIPDDGLLDPIEFGGRPGFADVFAFAKGSGHDTIEDFGIGAFSNGAYAVVDKIDLTGYINIRAMEDLSLKAVNTDLGIVQRLMLSDKDWIDFAPNQRAQDFLGADDIIFSTAHYTYPDRTVVGSLGSDELAGRTGDDKIDGGGVNDYGNDILDGREGNDTMNGRAGNDTLIGGAGADKMTGGTGDDIFVFNAISDSTAAHPDIITDFGTVVDHVDLSAIDWNKKAFGDQSFSIDTDGVLAPGELSVTKSGHTITISINADHDKAVDMVIVLTNQQFGINFNDLIY